MLCCAERLQEVVRPPEGTPDNVLPLLAAAQAVLQAHDITGALDAYEQAAEAWRVCLQPAGSSAQPGGPVGWCVELGWHCPVDCLTCLLHTATRG
jgi:hypothetical protein